MRNKLYIANIPWGTTEEELKAVFAICGTVKSCRIIKDKENGRSRGFGFIEMSTDQEAEFAIKNIDQQEVDGRKISVKFAENPN